MSTGIFDGMTLTWGDLGLTKAKPPAHLPDPSSLVTFDMAKKKAEIFEAVRERVKAKAQHTKNVSCTLRPQAVDTGDGSHTDQAGVDGGRGPRAHMGGHEGYDEGPAQGEFEGGSNLAFLELLGVARDRRLPQAQGQEGRERGRAGAGHRPGEVRGGAGGVRGEAGEEEAAGTKREGALSLGRVRRVRGDLQEKAGEEVREGAPAHGQGADLLPRQRRPKGEQRLPRGVLGPGPAGSGVPAVQTAEDDGQVMHADCGVWMFYN
ncbi:hypothetical protein THAOC_16699 [Thalassiosira oceanica]|uniref:Uncharacterized protein n=1 Tax=Thalassiosira oceanica TaxID=159749 RepID=K0SBM8_THAOC|nr:hypothetical protein THAOC_16699 [Thalassiosira oceanica]|eukprot:EJK62680.1 hypothetical protein THAOC_16699 [Thalassiosira oceanica]